jgi:PAS domain S-box-containing protein
MGLGIMPSQDDKSYEPIAELVRINPVPSMIMDMETLTIVLVNEATAKLLGRPEKELLGKSVLDFVPPGRCSRSSSRRRGASTRGRNSMALPR